MQRTKKWSFAREVFAAVFAAAVVIALVFLPRPPAAMEDAGSVVVYTALDRFYSEPILKQFEKETGIAVRPRYDTEATKTTGLYNRIVAESGRPRCDVFWNNEVLFTVSLKRRGLLEVFRPPNARDIPAAFKDRDDYWTGFAARARVIVYNTDLLTSETAPSSVLDFAKSQWRGKLAIAYPLFGTTRTHSALLFQHWGADKAREYFRSLKENNVRILDGNAMVCKGVARGEFVAGLTDTDDVHAAQEDGRPVDFILPDQGPGEMGALLIPNTLSLIHNCPNPEGGRLLIDFLLRPEIENQLAVARSAQIPVRPGGARSKSGIVPSKVRLVPFDYDSAEQQMAPAVDYLKDLFVR